jgi:hypothetical protein
MEQIIDQYPPITSNKNIQKIINTIPVDEPSSIRVLKKTTPKSKKAATTTIPAIKAGLVARTYAF